MSSVGHDPEETEESIRIPGPGGDCETTATIVISEDQGITALYCGDSKKVRTYIFAKDKTWDMEKAQEWVDEHKEGAGDIFLTRLIELDILSKAGDQEGERTEEERAQAHFDLTEEVWGTLSAKAKSALIAALPERGEGADDMSEDELKAKIAEIQQKIDDLYAERPDNSEIEVLYAEKQAYQSALAELIKKRVLPEEAPEGGVDEVARSKRLLSDPRLKRDMINVHTKTS